MKELDRIIVPVYNKKMHEVVKEVYPFHSFIFMLYQYSWEETAEELSRICRWCTDRDAITIWSYLSDEEVREIAERYDKDIYLHTVNNILMVREFWENGDRGIYMDRLWLEELEEEK